MTCTLDGKTLTALSITEDLEIIGYEWDQWDATTYKAVKKLTPFGASHRWTVRFAEDSVAWSSGSALSFQNTASAGTAVTFTITDQVRVVSATVKIKKVDVGPIEDLAGHNIRRVTLELLETS
jgi:hypothetical protein